MGNEEETLEVSVQGAVSPVPVPRSKAPREAVGAVLQRGARRQAGVVRRVLCPATIDRRGVRRCELEAGHGGWHHVRWPMTWGEANWRTETEKPDGR